MGDSVAERELGYVSETRQLTAHHLVPLLHHLVHQAKETPGVADKAFNTDTTMAIATPHFLSIRSPALATRPATPSATCKQPTNAGTSSEVPRISGLTKFNTLNTSSKMAALVTFSGRCVFISCRALACVPPRGAACQTRRLPRSLLDYTLSPLERSWSHLPPQPQSPPPLRHCQHERPDFVREPVQAIQVSAFGASKNPFSIV